MIKVVEVVCGLQNGGVESFLYNYISKINNENYSFDIITHGKSNENTKNKFEKIGCKIIEITPKRKNFIKNLFQLYYYLKNNDYDVIHCHMSINNAIPLIIARKVGIKLRISHSHQAIINEKSFRKIKKYLFREIILKNANKYVACGENAGKYLYGKKFKNYTVIHNAINVNNFKFNRVSREKIRKELNINKDEILLGNVGRFSYQKNHDFLIELLKYMNNDMYKLLLIGNGELKNEIIEKVKKYNLENQVIFLENINNVNDYMSAMDIFLLPSLFEGLPLVAIEAQTSGVNCLFSKNIDNEVKINENAKLLDLNILEWEREIETTNINRINNIKKIRKRGYDIETEIEKFEKLYTL